MDNNFLWRNNNSEVDITECDIIALYLFVIAWFTENPVKDQLENNIYYSSYYYFYYYSFHGHKFF